MTKSVRIASTRPIRFPAQRTTCGVSPGHFLEPRQSTIHRFQPEMLVDMVSPVDRWRKTRECAEIRTLPWGCHSELTSYPDVEAALNAGQEQIVQIEVYQRARRSVVPLLP